MGGFDLLKTLKAINEAGYTAMTLSATALLAVAYMHWIETPAFDLRVTGVETNVRSIREGQLEGKLDQAYAALCQNPGDSPLLERIRELQGQYWEVTHARYTAPSCDLLLKIKGP